MAARRPFLLFRKLRDSLKQTDEPQENEEQASFGPSRVLTRLTEHGIVEYRPDEILVDVQGFLGLEDDEDVPIDAERVVAVLKEIVDASSDVGQRSLSIDPERLGPLSTGFARLDLRGADPLDFAESENTRFEGEQRPFSINTVFRISAFTADPVKFAGSMSADPVKFAAALGLDPVKFANSSTARPVGKPRHLLEPAAFGDGADQPKTTVAILDTGDPTSGNSQISETADENGDDYLDVAAGHALFIQHIVARAQPATEFWFEGVMENDGDGDDLHVAAALDRVRMSVSDHEHLIVNLSFSGYYPGDEPPPGISRAINRLMRRRVLVVAAAGNDGQCRVKFPAGMPGVVSVGALGPCGPADFSNHGHWVDVSAPGEDLVSCFFDGFVGPYEPLPGSLLPDIDDFEGWAMWSGTSFSTPVVVGAIAQTMKIYSCTALEAARIVLRRPGLYRMPDYGVIINRIF